MCFVSIFPSKRTAKNSPGGSKKGKSRRHRGGREKETGNKGSEETK